MPAYYHVYIVPKDGSTREDIEVVLDKALDWFRYSSNLYVLYTSKKPDVWQARLRPLAEPDGSLFICKLDPSEKNGWMTPRFWEFLNKDRSAKSN